jgi:signal transduction histidine kinase
MTFGPSPLRRIGTYLLLPLAAAVLAVSVLAGGAYIRLPDIGFSFGQGDTVGYVRAGGPANQAGLQVGDRVLTIGEVSPFAGKLYARAGQAVLPLTVLRDDETIELGIRPTPPSGGRLVDRVGFLLTALLFWVFAVVLLTYKPRDGQAQVLALQLLLVALLIPALMLADSGLGWASLLTNTLVLFLGILIVYYHTVFPERVEFRGKRVLLAALTVVGSFLLAAFAWVRLGPHLDWSTPVVVAVQIFFVLCLGLSIVLLVRSYRRSASAAGRRQIRVVVLGTALAILPLVTFILVPQIVPNVPYVVLDPAILALAFMPASYLYAIRRHDLMRLDRFVSENAIRFLLFLTLFLLYLAISGAVRLLASLLPPEWLGSDGVNVVQYGAAIAGVMASLQPLRIRIERFVYRMLYGGWYDYQSFISRLTEGLGEALDMDEIPDLLLREIVDTMRLKAAALLVVDRHRDNTLCLQAQRGFALPAGQRLGRDLASLLANTTGPTEQMILQERAPQGSSARAELAAWAQVGARVWVPLVQQGEIEGVLVLGAKQADEFLTRTDWDILDTLRRHAASAIARARMVEEVQGRLREIQALSHQLLTVRERDRQRIATDIHRYAIQEIIGARMKLELALRDFNPEMIAAARRDLQDALDHLRSVVGELRPRAAEFSDLETMLTKHAAAFQSRRQVPVQVHVRGNGSQVPKTVRLALFYVFEESLTNAWKHAKPQQIQAHLDIQPNHIRLEVQDDGRGFDMPPYLDELLDDGHLGLMEMRQWMAGVGGSLELWSERGEGCWIVAEVALDPGQSGKGG